MRPHFACLLALACAGSLAAAKTLDIYFVDVEGGQATLMVTPSGQSLLVDTGWPGFNGRDADRIAAAAKKAGVRQIDYLVISHFHRDHAGGVPQLAERIPIVHFVDHGPNTESGAAAGELFTAYEKAMAKGKHIVVKPGDRIPLRGVDVQVVTARGEQIGAPLAGAGQMNPLCASTERRALDQTENARSVGVLVSYGKFRFVDLGDLSWNKELDLVCPANRVGTVDVYLTTHHGMNMSGPAAIVHALRPRVAIMNNGARKGGTPEAWQAVKSSPGLEDFWQVHFSIPAGKENNVGEAQIANLEEACQGFGVQLSAESDGSFSVVNQRTGFRKSYAARAQ